MQIWLYTRKNTRILQQLTLTYSDFDPSSLSAFVKTGCEAMRLPVPMVLTLQETDWVQFGFCAFPKSNFIEAVPFDDLQVRKIITAKQNDEVENIRRRGSLD